MKLTYHEENGYLIPDVAAPPATKIGVWGTQRKEYLRQHRRPVYTGLQLAGKLNAHLEEVDRQAQEMFDLLISQMADREGITEQLKARDQMAWIGAMNNIRQRAEEIVWQELIVE